MEVTFIKYLKEALEREDEVALADKFREYEQWDSLAALSIIAMIDEEFHVIITGDDVRSSVTVEDLFRLVQSRQ